MIGWEKDGKPTASIRKIERQKNMVEKIKGTEQAARLMRLATYASVSVASILIVAKVVAWVMTDSLSLLSTLVDSFLDVLASLVNMYAVRHALEPADEEHRFGHGKAEPLAGLAQAAFIGGSSVFLLLQGAERLVNPRTVSNLETGVGVMGFAVVLTLGLVIFQRYVAKKTGSVAIAADSLHYQSDLLVNIGVAISMLLAVKLGWTLADPVFAILVALYILKGAWEIGRSSLDLLMDKEFPEEERQKIHDVVMAVEGVRDLHDLRTRSSGPQSFIQLHVEMDGDLKLRSAHAIADNVEKVLEKAFPGAEVLVHQDPAGLEEPTPLQRTI